MPSSLRRLLGATITAAVASSVGLTPAGPVDAAETCPDLGEVLVLGAMPLEVQPLLDAAELDPDATVRAGGRSFFRGTLSGTPVVIAMTRIGLVNATTTLELALDHEAFSCGFDAVVFSGVAGSTERIGDVAIADRWTLDGGTTWIDVDPSMLDVAARHADGWESGLSADVPTGDAACACPGVDTLATPVSVGAPRRIVVGGTGTSGDTYGGKALPCVPGGGDVFGCEPCLTPDTTLEDMAEFATSAPTYLDPGFFSAFFTPPDQTTSTHVSQDQESAAVAELASERAIPFLAVRAVSDGEEDPLSLPGFPFQFFAYRHLAGDNAAAVTIDFLADWVDEGRPTGALA